jgi:hypothetical protein
MKHIRLFSICLLIAVTIGFALRATATDTVKGYLMDNMCAGHAAQSKDPAARARKHTKGCALMEACEKSGYGVVTTDGKYYKFDAKGNDLAKSLLGATKKSSDLSVEVVGTIDGDTIKVDSLKETEIASAAK